MKSPCPDPWSSAPESTSLPSLSSSWAKRTSFYPKFSGENNASDSSRIIDFHACILFPTIVTYIDAFIGEFNICSDSDYISRVASSSPSQLFHLLLLMYLKENGALSPSIAVSFALDIARRISHVAATAISTFQSMPLSGFGSSGLFSFATVNDRHSSHKSPAEAAPQNFQLYRNVLLVNKNADHLKVKDIGLSKLVKVKNSHDAYKMTGETGSYMNKIPSFLKIPKRLEKIEETVPGDYHYNIFTS
ncbi:hypothetical protein LguiA_033060 [Lonicera macranthoides]